MPLTPDEPHDWYGFNNPDRASSWAAADDDALVVGLSEQAEKDRFLERAATFLAIMAFVALFWLGFAILVKWIFW